MAQGHGVDSALLVARVAAAARARPDAVAIVARDRTVSYAELWGRVAVQAERLGESGVGPGDTVAVAFERGVDYVVAILGVLASGATCLPLNPAEPAARLTRILRGARAGVVLGDAAPADLPAGVARIAPAPLRDTGLTPERVLGTADDLAFLFTTSGSTGEPKIVGLTHAACALGVDWARTELSIGDDDRHLFRTSPSFVGVLRQVLWPLATGGTCVVLPPGMETDLGQVARTLSSAAITVTTFIPSALRVALPYVRAGSCPELRHILSGAEPLTEEVRTETYARFSATLHNLYAPTEAPMVTHHECRPGEHGPSPLGRPVCHAVLRIVTPTGDLAAPGERGEIYVGGPGVSAGYLLDGRLDRDHFVPDTWGGAGALLRTGDFAEVDTDGTTLRYVSRTEDFVKVRGYRVAPGEVESAVSRHPGVAAVTVLAVRRSATSSLAAFVVPRTGSELAEHDVRAFLETQLPAHLIPDRIFCVDAFPRTASGKIDRYALTTWTEPGSGRPVAEPRDALEAAIRTLWQDILKVERVGIHDKFRDLGGDSLAAVELAFRLDDLLDTELPSEIFSNAATVAELAAACRDLIPAGTLA